MLVRRVACFSFLKKCSLCWAHLRILVVFIDQMKMHSNELLHCGVTDAEGCVLRVLPPEINNHFLSFIDIEHQIIVCPPAHKVLNLPPL